LFRFYHSSVKTNAYSNDKELEQHRLIYIYIYIWRERERESERECLKTISIAATLAQKTPGRTAQLHKISPGVKEACLSCAHSFASPATHEQIKVKVEIEVKLPVQGLGQAGLAPLNLRSGSLPSPVCPYS